MGIVPLIVVFSCTWWLIFFLVLPMGISPEKTPLKGNEIGAPRFTYLKEKGWITTGMAFLASLLFYIWIEGRG